MTMTYYAYVISKRYSFSRLAMSLLLSALLGTVIGALLVMEGVV